MNWFKQAQRNRGRWGNPQTDESRGTYDALQERYRDNEVVYGEHIRA